MRASERRSTEVAGRYPPAFENSDRLYYVADWTDEYCNLTLDKMLKVIGEDALELNKASLRKMIEKIKA